MTLLLLGSGAAALCCSYWLLEQGWESVLGRYPLAVLIGYLSFVLLFRIWLQWVRWQYSDRELDQFEVEPDHSLAGRGKRDSSNVLDWFDLPIEADGIGCLIVAVLLLVFALCFGAWWLVSDAALLMTDVAVQFLFAGLLTRRLKYVSNAHWLSSVLKATFWPLFWTFLTALILAIAMSLYCPEASTLRAAFATSCRN